MNARQCTYLLAIADLGYLSHAAEKLGVTQAALNKFLAEQERLMGTALFVRYRKQLYPTPAGQIFLDAAQQFLRVRNHTLQAVGAMASAGAAIRIASTPYRGAEMFSRVYTQFLSLFPNVELTLEESFSAQQEEMIHSGTIDFACGSNCHNNYPDVFNLPISREEVVLAVPPFHPLAQYAGSDVEHLVSMPLRAFRDTPFVLRSPKNNLRIVADGLFALAGFRPVIAFESGNDIVVDSMLHQGIGVGFLSRRYAKPADGLVYFRLDPPCHEVTYLRYPKARRLSDAERYLCGLIVRERLRIPGNELIPGPVVKSFLTALSGEDNRKEAQ